MDDYDDDEDAEYGDPSQPGHRYYRIWLEIELGKASGTTEWHAALASLIRNSLIFKDYELAEFANLVSAPRKLKRGRPAEAGRHNEIFMWYHFRVGGRPHFVGTRAEAIQDIRRRYPTLREESAATKAYDRAKACPYKDPNDAFQRQGNK